MYAIRSYYVVRSGKRRVLGGLCHACRGDFVMRVISWNIQWGRGADGAVNFSRVLDTLRALGPFDVICLQRNNFV